MSRHKEEKPEDLRGALLEHRLPADSPSQLSDAFVAGWEAAHNKPIHKATRDLREGVEVIIELLEYLPNIVDSRWHHDIRESRQEYLDLLKRATETEEEK